MQEMGGKPLPVICIKKAVEQHNERTAFYTSITREDAVPLLVTLVEEEIQCYEGVPLVPVLRLNSFIHELDTDAGRNLFREYEDDMAYPDEPWPGEG